mmetsp:Transcript_50881/g.115581  ORF Transcript_50881/g.115581 Transcript_50881/m.115581 type:complete len:643 (+) Transcript_50881:229-2157(+)
MPTEDHSTCHPTPCARPSKLALNSRASHELEVARIGDEELGPEDGETVPMLPSDLKQPPDQPLHGPVESVELTSGELHLAAVSLGLVSAVLVPLYAAALRSLVELVWVAIPTRFRLGPGYVVAACTFGATLVGLLGPLLPESYGVGQFILDTAPATRTHAQVPEYPSLKRLVPVVLLTLLTSGFGMSLGPEAPMVCSGAILGGALARRIEVRRKGKKLGAASRRCLAAAGSSGALSAFLKMPLVGAFFTLELLSPTVGMEDQLGEGDGTVPREGGGAREVPGALSPALAASLASQVSAAVALGLFFGSKGSATATLGGNLDYTAMPDSTVGPMTGGGTWPAHLLAPATALGALGGLLAALLAALVRAIKRAAAPAPPDKGKHDSSEIEVSSKFPWRGVAFRSAAGLVAGGIGVLWPHTLLWGETRLSSLLAHRPCTAIASGLTARALVGRGGAPPVLGSQALEVGLAKMVSIAVAFGCGLPGGVIYPLFFAGAALGQGLSWPNGHQASNLPYQLTTVGLMAALQASTTRTPLSSALMLAFSGAPRANIAALLPLFGASAYAGVWASHATGLPAFFAYPHLHPYLKAHQAPQPSPGPDAQLASSAKPPPQGPCAAEGFARADGAREGLQGYWPGFGGLSHKLG